MHMQGCLQAPNAPSPHEASAAPQVTPIRIEAFHYRTDHVQMIQDIPRGDPSASNQPSGSPMDKFAAKERVRGAAGHVLAHMYREGAIAWKETADGAPRDRANWERL